MVKSWTGDSMGVTPCLRARGLDQAWGLQRNVIGLGQTQVYAMACHELLEYWTAVWKLSNMARPSLNAGADD